MIPRYVIGPDERPGLVHTTTVSLAEILFGIARLPAGRRKNLVAATSVEVFGEPVLPFHAAAARAYSDVVVEREHVGAPIAGFDAQIAAICRSHRASLATRTTEDFTDLDLHLIDPWFD